MSLVKNKTLVTLKLPQLQNLIKRDAVAYTEEFTMQKKHFDSELEIFNLRPTVESDRFVELLTFMSHVAPYYKSECRPLAMQLLTLLEKNASILHAHVRSKLFQALIILRNRDMLDPLVLLKLSFSLFAIEDKSLRSHLTDYIINDVKTLNHGTKNNKLNRQVQTIIYSILDEENSVAAKKAVYILSELYRRRIWVDARTVNVLGAACLSNNTAVMVGALNFFLGIETRMQDDEEADKEAVTKAKIEITSHEHSKKTRSRTRHVERQKAAVAKQQRQKLSAFEAAVPLFPAIQLLHDPQELAEKLFKRLRQSCEKFDVKLLLMNFLSRLIGCHNLLLLQFYSFLQKYLTSHTQDVTLILTYLIQACHSQIPPDELVPVIKAISFNFITERSSDEVLTVGINAVREILQRVPSILREPDMSDLIQDLAQYSRKTHKSVMIAAHSVVNLVREVYPTLLHKSYRGKYYNADSVPTKYGELSSAEGVEGIELLESYERGDIIIDEDGEVVFREDEEDMEEIEEEEEMSEDDEEAPELVEIEEGESNEEDEDADEESEDEEEASSDEGDWEDVESDDDDNAEEDSGEWEDVSHDSDEENENDAQSESAPSRPSLENVRNRVDSRRILTASDFEMLNRLKAAVVERMKDPKRRSQKHKNAVATKSFTTVHQDDDDESERPASSFMVSPDSLVPTTKLARATKMERLEKVLSGQKENKFELGGHAGGLTNKEKLRKKNFLMVRRGKRAVANKIRESKRKQHDDVYGRDRRKRRRT